MLVKGSNENEKAAMQVIAGKTHSYFSRSMVQP
jgi:hypothetical protein